MIFVARSLTQSVSETKRESGNNKMAVLILCCQLRQTKWALVIGQR